MARQAFELSSKCGKCVNTALDCGVHPCSSPINTAVAREALTDWYFMFLDAL